ncbi:DUF2293 domain-containing protein [Flindersiella endophytica]
MKLTQRVETAAAAALAKQKYVAPVDVLAALGWVSSRSIDRWRQGRISRLGIEIQVDTEKLRAAVAALEGWAQANDLQPMTVDYVSSTRERRPLAFVGAGDETSFRTHWISPDLPESRRAKLVERQSKAPDLEVVQPEKDFTCAECGRRDGSLLMLEDGAPLCLTCVDLDHLVFLPAGDTALTRRSKQASTLSAIVVRWNKRRKRHERKGTLVEEAALETAEQQCLADADARARQRERGRERREREDVQLYADMTAEILRLFPACPADRAERIARHAAVRGSGRVGRSAAGRSLDPEAVTFAVVASVRHEDTDYDQLLMSGVPRDIARERIRDTIDKVLDGWRVAG